LDGLLVFSARSFNENYGTTDPARGPQFFMILWQQLEPYKNIIFKALIRKNKP